ncbi:MAG: hypothetical protein AAFY90_12765 [Pseudomonadota bacterium]
MQDIDPNLRLNKIAAAMMGVLAFLFFYVSYDMFVSYGAPTDQDSLEWGLLAVPAGIGGILLLFAIVILQRPPINAARVRFRSGGFRLDAKQIFRPRQDIDLNWADVTAVTMHNGGLYGGRMIKVEQAPGNEIAKFAPAWTACSSNVIIDRLQASAEASGYTFKKEARSWFASTKERCLVTPKT